MNLSDYDFDLPPDRIAQDPVEPRDAARLLVHHLAAARTRHGHVRELGEELRAGDLLVLNDTRVRPARLNLRRATGGQVELLLLEPVERPAGAWRALARPARKLGESEELRGASGLRARLEARERDEDGGPAATWLVTLSHPEDPALDAEALLEREGTMPLPPYIERAPGDPRAPRDRERYQTVYARESGAVAAPTAGLHLTRELLAALGERGVETTTVTLHVGLGTFLPVQVEDPRDHVMHAERYELTPAAADAVARARARGGRVVAVGTTSTRVLESCVGPDGALTPGHGETRLFLHPGNPLRVVDGLLTNFHLPRSTLLMLVSALAGRERVLELYAEAVREGYRFYSYGDAMLLLP